MSLHKPAYRTRRHAGFTIIENFPLDVVAIALAILFPHAQSSRETTNQERAQKDVGQIVQAETRAGKPTTDLTALAKLGLIDATLGSGDKDGYHFTVTTSPAGGFQVVGVPAAPGVTGSADVMADQSGKMVSTPSQGADAARSAMFAAIEREGATALGSLISKATPDQRTEMQRFVKAGSLQSPDTLTGTFKQLDTNGNGSVTFSKLLAYDPKGESPEGSFLITAGRLMQLGLANEDVKSLPGVGMSGILPANRDGDSSPFSLNIVRGASSIVTDGSRSGLAMAGLCNGTVSDSESTPTNLDGAKFSALLSAVDPSLVSGRFVIGSEDRSVLHGILVGRLTPDSRSSRQIFDGFFLITGGSEALNGAVGGGQASIVWSDPKLDRFESALTGGLIFSPSTTP